MRHNGVSCMTIMKQNKVSCMTDDEIWDMIISCDKKNKQSKLLNNINQLPDDVIDIILDYMPSYIKDITAMGKIKKDYHDEFRKGGMYPIQRANKLYNVYEPKIRKYFKFMIRKGYNGSGWSGRQEYRDLPNTFMVGNRNLDRRCRRNDYPLFFGDYWLLGKSLVKDISKKQLIEIADKNNINIKKSWNRSKMIGVMIKHF